MKAVKIMKILVIKTTPYDKEGMTSVVLNIYENIDHPNVQMDFISIGKLGQLYIGIFKNNESKYFIVQRSFKKIIRYITSVMKIVRDGKYDIVHIHGNSHTTVLDLLASKLGGCKVRIVHAHNTKTKYPFIHSVLTPVFNMLCTGRLACGADAGKFMYGKKKFNVINNGVNTERFRFNPEPRQLMRKKYNIENKRVLCHVGSFLPVKNHTFLLDIMKELIKDNDNYSLVLIGDGILYDEIKDKARKMGIDRNIIFVGSTNKVEEYLSAADLLLMPSLYEGLPLSLIEAQTNGLHCIVSDKITTEVDKTGNLTFLPIDKGIECWIKNIKEYDFNPDREAKGKIAVSKIIKSGYSIPDEVGNLINYYKNLLYQTKYGGGI